MKINNVHIEFYKEDLNFPISGVDVCSFYNSSSIRRILKLLNPLINKKTNVHINLSHQPYIFISNLINFCKIEDIDYTHILELEVLQDICDDHVRYKIIVNYGTAENVQVLDI